MCKLIAKCFIDKQSQVGVKRAVILDKAPIRTET